VPPDPAATSAPNEGPEWSVRAPAWSELWGGLAAARGAQASGIDAAEGMIAIARRRVPGADLRVGPMEALPWDDGSFDVVTGINAFQFAADVTRALGEARRVTRAGGRVAAANWARPGGREEELLAVTGALRALAPPVADPPATAPAAPSVGEPGVVEELARAAGLAPQRTGSVEVRFAAPDLATLERAVLDGAGLRGVTTGADPDAVRETIREAAAPFRQPDGAYRFTNEFVYVVATA
jgi:SAM-dependent methyltransferase